MKMHKISFQPKFNLGDEVIHGGCRKTVTGIRYEITLHRVPTVDYEVSYKSLTFGRLVSGDELELYENSAHLNNFYVGASVDVKGMDRHSFSGRVVSKVDRYHCKVQTSSGVYTYPTKILSLRRP